MGLLFILAFLVNNLHVIYSNTYTCNRKYNFVLCNFACKGIIFFCQSTNIQDHIIFYALINIKFLFIVHIIPIHSKLLLLYYNFSFLLFSSSLFIGIKSSTFNHHLAQRHLFLYYSPIYHTYYLLF